MPPDGSPDLRAHIAALRPQIYGSGSPHKVLDPIIEPLWVGIRALGFVDDGGTRVINDEGDPVEAVDAILGALTEAARASALVLDGFLTKQASHQGRAVYQWSTEAPSMSSLIGLRRNRAVDAVALREEALAARTLDADEEISFVATDLLWLDDTSLLDVPLLERRRLLESVIVESDLIRHGIYVRPPIDSWVASWRAQGFGGLTYKAANSRYRSGETSSDWAVGGMPRR